MTILAAIAGARNTILTGAVAVALCLPVGYCSGYSAAKQKAEAERSAANVIAQTRAITTADQAAIERVDDALAVAQQEGELTDAIADTPDGAPDDVRVQLGCQRLRSQGTPEADLPAVCGPS